LAIETQLAFDGLSYEIVLRHEVGHCNGWPGDHPGMRVDFKNTYRRLKKDAEAEQLYREWAGGIRQ
jgi:hypothetical protein